MFTTADIFFTNYNIQTDNSVLFTTDIQNESLSVQEYGDYRAQYSLYGTNPNNPYSTFFFNRGRFTQYYSRTYMKLTDVLAQLGGFVNSMLAIAAVVVGFYNSSFYVLELANKFYDFDIHEENKEKLRFLKDQFNENPRLRKNMHIDQKDINNGLNKNEKETMRYIQEMDGSTPNQNQKKGLNLELEKMDEDLAQSAGIYSNLRHKQVVSEEDELDDYPFNFTNQVSKSKLKGVPYQTQSNVFESQKNVFLNDPGSTRNMVNQTSFSPQSMPERRFTIQDDEGNNFKDPFTLLTAVDSDGKIPSTNIGLINFNFSSSPGQYENPLKSPLQNAFDFKIKLPSIQEQDNEQQSNLKIDVQSNSNHMNDEVINSCNRISPSKIHQSEEGGALNPKTSLFFKMKITNEEQNQVQNKEAAEKLKTEETDRIKLSEQTIDDHILIQRVDSFQLQETAKSPNQDVQINKELNQVQDAQQLGQSNENEQFRELNKEYSDQLQNKEQSNPQVLFNQESSKETEENNAKVNGIKPESKDKESQPVKISYLNRMQNKIKQIKRKGNQFTDDSNSGDEDQEEDDDGDIPSEHDQNETINSKQVKALSNMSANQIGMHVRKNTDTSIMSHPQFNFDDANKRRNQSLNFDLNTIQDLERDIGSRQFTSTNILGNLLQQQQYQQHQQSIQSEPTSIQNILFTENQLLPKQPLQNYIKVNNLPSVNINNNGSKNDTPKSDQITVQSNQTYGAQHQEDMLQSDDQQRNQNSIDYKLREMNNQNHCSSNNNRNYNIIFSQTNSNEPPHLETNRSESFISQTQTKGRVSTFGSSYAEQQLFNKNAISNYYSRQSENRRPSTNQPKSECSDNEFARNQPRVPSTVRSENGNQKRMSYLESKSRQSAISKELSKMNERRKKISYTFKYMIYKLSCEKLFRTKQNQMVDKAQSLITKDLDIIKILDKIQEIDRIKCLLLDYEQLVLFNYFPKPLVQIENNELVFKQYAENLNTSVKVVKTLVKAKDKLKGLLSQKNQNHNNLQTMIDFSIFQDKQDQSLKFERTYGAGIGEYEKIFQAYRKIQSKPVKTQTDNILVDLMGQELQKIFESMDKPRQKKRTTSKKFSFTLKSNPSHLNANLPSMIKQKSNLTKGDDSTQKEKPSINSRMQNYLRKGPVKTAEN